MKEKPESVDLPTWYSNGTMMYRRDALPFNHPESQLSYFKKHYPDLDPRDYGIETGTEKCEHCGK